MSDVRLSVFDMLKIGVGPSSSHTMGPWRAAQRFLAELPAGLPSVERLSVDLYGSLSKTGRGHGTDVAVQLGLLGEDPETCDVSKLRSLLKQVSENKQIVLCGSHAIAFDPKANIVFHETRLPFHPNGIAFTANLHDASEFTRSYYSIGGGFIVGDNEVASEADDPLPLPISTAADVLAHCARAGGRISDIVLQNELSMRCSAEIAARLAKVKETMIDCVYRGCHTEGTLPGGLSVERRAAKTARRLLPAAASLPTTQWLAAIANSRPDFRQTLQWVSCFALAVNEENAAFGRVVTAPTNGAAGVIPAVMLYAQLFCDLDHEGYARYLITAGQIGCLFKKGATISAALGGCQAEIGVASAMAAAALTELLGGTPEQVVIAAEIAMEHHLGMTCDPIGGLVQIPCIERNAFGAIKAITAAGLALERTPADARVSLDAVIRTMWETAQGMSERYKETSEGGLAIQIAVNVSEC